MNKRQKEIIGIQIESEKKLIEELKKIYEQALDDINNRIAALLARSDEENLKTIIYQLDYQRALKKQISAILDDLNARQFNTISEYLTKCYEMGFIGTLYDLQGQGIPLIFPINQEHVVRALTVDTKLSKRLYTALGEDVEELKKAIRSELSRGISTSLSYADIARNVKNRASIGFNRSMRIVRTEGHRITCAATYDAQHEAKEAGADIVKQWDSTLDKRTRKSHRELDGQIKELDEPFIYMGYKAQFPSDFGVPSLDINCRCVLLQRARWALEGEGSFTKWDSEHGGYLELKEDTYEDFKKSYYKALDKK